MRSVAYLPSPVLQPFIKSFLIHETDTQSTYDVLPDTSLVIGFQYKGRLSNMVGGEEISLAVSGVSGLADHAKTFKNSSGIGTVLVLFKDGGAAPFFRQPLHELFRESVSLDNFMLRSELLSFENQLVDAKTDAQRIAVVEKFLAARLNSTTPDQLVAGALGLIYKTQGKIRMKELAEQLHTSQSPLEKRFRQVVGASPKKFASIVRFKNVLQQYDRSRSLTELGYAAGFYDQAHFIKEFRSFTGRTPEDFFTGQ